MVKMEISTSSTEIHTKAASLDVKHAHERRQYSSPMVWFDFDVDEKIVIEKGFQISVYDCVEIPIYGETAANLLADANFDPLVFLDKVTEECKKRDAESKKRDAEEQQEAEEKQQRESTIKQARELLAEDFKRLEEEINDLKAKLERKTERISRLAEILASLIRKATDLQLEDIGLYHPSLQEGEEEQPTEAQQEALETLDLDC
jgi:hypothetical protein